MALDVVIESCFLVSISETTSEVSSRAVLPELVAINLLPVENELAFVPPLANPRTPETALELARGRAPKVAAVPAVPELSKI